MKNFSYNNKTFIVSGAAGGIGSILTRRLLSKGAKVLACDFNETGLGLLEKELTSFGANLSIFKLNVIDKKSWEKAFMQIEKKGWSLFGLINCAAILIPGNLLETDLSEIDKHIDINVKGSILGSILSAKILTQKKYGHIVNIASLAGVAPIPGIGLYSTSKFAVRGFTLALADELISHNVNVSVICPDAVHVLDSNKRANYKKAGLTFSGSSLTPEEITDAIFKAIEFNKLEILLPSYRGFLVKLGNFSPLLSYLLHLPYQKAKFKKQETLKN